MDQLVEIAVPPCAAIELLQAPFQGLTSTVPPLLMYLCRHGLDWMVRAHIKASDDPADNVFVGQVSNNLVDHKYLGRPEHHTTPRPVYTASAHSGKAESRIVSTQKVHFTSYHVAWMM